jgi:hypothetical protein
MTPHEQLLAISQRAHELVETAYRIWNGELTRRCAREGICW